MKRWLDQILNAVSMYRLVSIALVTLLVFSAGLATIKLLPYSPIEIIASALVLTVSAYGFNVLFAWLFRVKPHNESTFITALILSFMFSPSINPIDLAALALVAMIAMGSKYVLAVRGRHIFNPAAVSAVIIGMMGIAYATWWVATPVLFPVTLLLAFVILYKTRRVQLGLLFLLIASVLIVATSVIGGQTLLSAIVFLASWPLLFFAGFMLSEPLTLPPRKWQRYLVGSVVAILFAMPIDIGPLSATPALALVIGNAIGYLFTQRRRIELVFRERKQLTKTSSEYVFEPKYPINYTAGQYMEITVPHTNKDSRGIRRIFSIVSAPGDPTVRFGIKMYDKPSSFKKTLIALKPGDIVNGTSVGGDFTLPDRENLPLLLIAGGIGITPFISHLSQLQTQKERRDIVLIYFVSTIDDVAYVRVLEASGIKVIIVTKSDERRSQSSWVYHNAQRLSANDITKYIPDVSARRAYVSGPPQMVDAMRSTLKEVAVKRISCDYFTGY